VTRASLPWAPKDRSNRHSFLGGTSQLSERYRQGGGCALECQPVKKSMLVLWLVGAAIYSVDTLFIVGPKSPSPQPPIQAHLSTDQIGNRPLRSWDPYLRGHDTTEPSSHPTSATTAKSDDHQHAPLPEISVTATTDDEAPLATEGASPDSAEANWVKVILPAKLHRAADVSSPVVNYYSPGTVLRAASVSDAWVAIIDPATQAQGWILQQYLSFTGSPKQLRTVEDDVPQPTAEKVASNTGPPSARSGPNTNLAESEPLTHSRYQRRHRRLGLLGLFRRF
jgi:hypothetical protein